MMRSMTARSYRIGELAAIAGVTVRTLHHYDERGLVVPERRSPSGYREYGEEQLRRVQHVLLYRQIGLSLDEITLLLGRDDDPRRLLAHQRRLLQQRQADLGRALALVEHSLEVLDDGGEMSTEEMFDGLGEVERNDALYGDEVRRRWGGTQAYEESTRRTKAYTPQDWSRIKAEGGEIEEGLAELLRQGVPAGDPAARDLAEQHRGHIDRWFYPCPHEMHAALGETYVSDPRLRAHYDERQAGLAVFVRDAIAANAAHHTEVSTGAEPSDDAEPARGAES
jgi:DNA-binding transcriptional MerR regulator